ncbi:MAG TPA: lamin tail domain-containing protein [Methylomirabilota bacterium]|nr:lamin tail domain-containing protein [Methylomirabilota bacterium]
MPLLPSTSAALCHVALILLFASFSSRSLHAERLGPSSKRTGLVISEIMYHPPPDAQGRNGEYIEIYNSEPFPADISGYRLGGSVAFSIPTGTTLPPFGFAVVAPAPADLKSLRNLQQVVGGFGNRTNSLPNSQGVVELWSKSGALLLQAAYSDEHPWPAQADGAGHSLVLHRPSYGEADWRAWDASSVAGGSPGTQEPLATEPLRNLKLNEILGNSDGADSDYVELHNRSAAALDLSDVALTDDPSTNKFTFPPQTTLAPGAFLHLTEAELGFSLEARGETLFLKHRFGPVLDAIRFDAQETGVAYGRFPNGSGEWRRLTSKTPGTPNQGVALAEIVISEIMYNSATGLGDDEYIELHNRSAGVVDLAGWRFESGIDFQFPSGARVGPGSYLVVARNATNLLGKYAHLRSTNVFGNYSGNLSGQGERIILSKPHRNQNSATNELLQVDVVDFTFRTGGEWPEWADGGGSSMELIDLNADPSMPSNWADSDESGKSPWTTVDVTGLVDNGTGSADQLQVLLQGRGDALIDNVEVISGGANRIDNSTFESGALGWTAQGTQSRSTLAAGQGFGGGNAYQITAVERGDNQVNRVRTPLTIPLAPGSVATIRAKVRWVQGARDMLFRIRGNYIEAPVRMQLPSNLGTPGLPNSRAVANAAPAIANVTHFPVLPSNEPVYVTAQVTDPDGVQTVRLSYQSDSATSQSSTPMSDNGLNGDKAAGDGVYTAQIPNQASGTVVRFRVTATDARGATTPVGPLTALIRFGEPRMSGTLGSYRVWMTQATLAQWNSRHKLDNSPNNVTFVYNDERVIYNVDLLYAGSPYIAPGYSGPTSGLAGYTGGFPEDQPFLGTTDLVLDWPGRDNTALAEHAAYWMADQIGLENNYRRYIRLSVNGVTETQRGSIYEDVEQPGREVMQKWYPEDSEGEIFKIDRWFEFSDTGSTIADPMPTLQNFTTTDLETGAQIKKRARYRWNWMPRSADDPNYFDNLFALVDAVNAPGPEPYTYVTEALVDVEQWMAIFALEHIVNNFDSYGHNIGKNMYAYKPEAGKWQLHMFDIDWIALASQGAGYGTTASLFDSNDPVIRRMYNHPPFRRAYFRAVKKVAYGPMAPENLNAWMDARYAGLVSENVTRSAGQLLAPPTNLKAWAQARRDYLLQQLATIEATFAITSVNGGSATTISNVITVTGRAPIEVKNLRVNGVVYPTTWTGNTDWALRIPVQVGANTIVLEGVDPEGQVVADARGTFTLTRTGVAESPAGQVVITEIMHQPSPHEDAEFVEVHNRSLNKTVDLSGWRLNGADFTFATGTILEPGEYLVIAQDLQRFANSYPLPRLIRGEYNGRLDDGGETLTLLAPAAANEWISVDAVTYDDDPPWPTAANGTGASLQLIDPNQENARVSNWAVNSAAGSSNAPPQWQYVTVTGTASSSRLYVYLTSAGEVYLDDLKLVAGPVPEVGANMIQNGDFESAFPGPWNVSANHSATQVSSTTKRSGASGLRLAASSGGTTQGSSVWQDVIPLQSGEVYTLSYWYLPSTNGSSLAIRLSGNGIRSEHPVAPQQGPSNLATPGLPNSVRGLLAGFPNVWINELLVQNVNGSADVSGEREPWVELFNGGGTAISLEGWHLTDNLGQLTRWAFPAGASIAAGSRLLVWLDAEPTESTPAAPHANFRLAAGGGSIALVYPVKGTPTVLDFINYAQIGPDRSIGFHPDGVFGARQIFAVPTPGGANNNDPLPISVVINEWMAANTSVFADPADGQYEDWFELHNAGSSPADLSGYQLSDSTAANAGRWTIPQGVIIAAGGYLVVWADEETEQNGPASLHLHANFKLSQGGEAIALFAPNGSLVNAVQFGLQTADEAQGRWPNGGESISLMPATPGSANRLGGPEPTEIHLSVVMDAAGMRLQWNSTSGATYELQSKGDLADAQWVSLRTIASGGAATSVTIEPNGERAFFRIVRR